MKWKQKLATMLVLFAVCVLAPMASAAVAPTASVDVYFSGDIKDAAGAVVKTLTSPEVLGEPKIPMKPGEVFTVSGKWHFDYAPLDTKGDWLAFATSASFDFEPKEGSPTVSVVTNSSDLVDKGNAPMKTSVVSYEVTAPAFACKFDIELKFDLSGGNIELKKVPPTAAYSPDIKAHELELDFEVGNNTGTKSGGCSAAYAPFALLLAAPLFLLRKKK